MFILAVCNNSTILSTLLFIKRIIDIIFIVAPILLILFVTIDFAKNVFAKDDQENQKNLHLAIRRIILCVAMLFVPLLVKSSMSFLDGYTKIASCYNNINDIYITKLQEKEEAKYQQSRKEQEASNFANAQTIAQEQQERTASVKEALKNSSKVSATKSDYKYSDKIGGTSSYTKKISSKPFTLKIKGPSNMKFSSSDSDIVYVTKDGVVYPNDIGKAVITVTSGAQTFTANVKIKKRSSKPRIGEAAYGNNGYGDQSGKEVQTGKWYRNHSYGNWDYVFRFKDPRRAEIAAAAMIATCENDKIGYENETKEKSMSFTRALEAVDWDPSKVKKKCATACSQCVLTMVQAAGYHRGNENYAYKNALSGANSLKKDSHFRTITNSSYTKDYDKLKAGDILVDTTGDRHMIMVVS